MRGAKNWYGGRPMMHAIGSTEMLVASSMIDDPAAPIKRKMPTAMQWRCGCGRIHKRAVDECAACGGRK